MCQTLKDPCHQKGPCVKFWEDPCGKRDTHIKLYNVHIIGHAHHQLELHSDGASYFFKFHKRLKRSNSKGIICINTLWIMSIVVHVGVSKFCMKDICKFESTMTNDFHHCNHSILKLTCYNSTCNGPSQEFFESRHNLIIPKLI